MPRSQQDKVFVRPTEKPNPVDLFKVEFKNSSLYDQALLARIERLEGLIVKAAGAESLDHAEAQISKESQS